MATNPRFADLLSADTVRGRASNLRFWAARHPHDPLAPELVTLWNRYDSSHDESIASAMWDLVEPLLDAPGSSRPH